MQPTVAHPTAALEPIRNTARENPRKRSRILRCLYHWTRNVLDVRVLFNGIAGYAWFLGDWRRYSTMRGAERLRFIDSLPQLHDRTATTPFDAHYFFLNGWAMRRIVALAPKSHVDIGSAVQFPNLLGAVIPTCFVDYRPLPARCAGMDSVAGDIASLPFADNSLASLSCLHVAEHIGLGRYGDALDPAGTRKAARELMRVLAPGGSLFFGLPVGVERTCFNAHRIHAPETTCSYFEGLELVEFSGVHDDGRFVEGALLEDFSDDVYACGMYWFRKPGARA
jgi:SAM-dependent methyltransferase